MYPTTGSQSLISDLVGPTAPPEPRETPGRKEEVVKIKEEAGWDIEDWKDEDSKGELLVYMPPN